MWTLVEGGDPAEGGRALGKVLLPGSDRTLVLLVAGAPVHLALSLGWAGVLGAVLPPRAEPLTGALGGLAIAGLDLAVLGRFFGPIAALPQGRQWADHSRSGSRLESCFEPLGERAVGRLQMARLDDGPGVDQLRRDAGVVAAFDRVVPEPATAQSSASGRRRPRASR